MSTSGHGNKENGSVVWQTGSTDVSDGASGKHSGVWAPDGLTHRSASDKCRTDSSGLYEPGADRKAAALLGNRSASGGAVSELAERLSPRKYGDIPFISPSGGRDHRGEGHEFHLAFIHGMVVFWYSWLFPRRSRRKKARWDHGPDRDGIFPVCGQHPGILGGNGAAYGICGEASLVSHRIQCAHRHGCRADLHCGQDSPCDSPGGGPQHHGNFLHRPAHEGKAHRGHGERLCAVRESQRRVGLVDLTSSWTSEHSSAGHDAAVRVGE